MSETPTTGNKDINEKRGRVKYSDDETSPVSKKTSSIMEKQLASIVTSIDVLVRGQGALSQGQVKLGEQFDGKLEELKEAFNLKIHEIESNVQKLNDEVQTMKTKADSIQKEVTENRAFLTSNHNRIDELKLATNRNEQSCLLNHVVVSGLPVISRDDVKKVMENVSKLMCIDFNETDYSAYQRKVNGKETSNIYVSFNAFQLKKLIRDKYKVMKLAPVCQILVEKLLDLKQDSPFNGKKFYILNKLTRMNMDMLNEARKHPEIFKYSYDTDDGRILVKCGDKTIQLISMDHLKQLVKSEAPPNQTMEFSS